MTLTRRVTFSAGHRYWIPTLSESENRARFGRWASPFNHGHNYVLDVSAAGDIEDSTGMVVNIKTIDDLLQTEIVDRFDQRSLNDEVPHFHDRSPTLENFILLLAELLQPSFAQDPRLGTARLCHLRLEEMPTLWAELDLPTNMLTITRTYEFAASHRLHVPTMSDAENLALFGKCNNAAGHGHNYVLEVTVTGDLDGETGMMVDLGALDRAVEERVVERYDHRHLNVDLPEFADKVPTSEVIVMQIWQALDGHVPGELRRVRLLETARSVFEMSR